MPQKQKNGQEKRQIQTRGVKSDKTGLCNLRIIQINADEVKNKRV